MKVILSRKGFDSQYGGYPSPIMPDGSLISLPIPSNDNIKYSELKHSPNRSYFDMMKQLNEWIKYNGDKISLTAETTCHLDPDLRKESLDRINGWKPIFGQIGNSQSHLQNQGIGKGDLFLFFGTFKETEYDINGNLKFKSSSSEKHVIYGYLEVEKILKTKNLSLIPQWMKYHPHTNDRRLDNKRNTIYVAKDKLTFDRNRKGGGLFHYDNRLVLTKKGHSKSKWDLDSIFKEVNITYHSKNSWKKEGFFQSRHKGQEFVIDCNKEVEDYFIGVIKNLEVT